MSSPLHGTRPQPEVNASSTYIARQWKATVSAPVPISLLPIEGLIDYTSWLVFFAPALLWPVRKTPIDGSVVWPLDGGNLPCRIKFGAPSVEF